MSDKLVNSYDTTSVSGWSLRKTMQYDKNQNYIPQKQVKQATNMKIKDEKLRPMHVIEAHASAEKPAGLSNQLE